MAHLKKNERKPPILRETPLQKKPSILNKT